MYMDWWNAYNSIMKKMFESNGTSEVLLQLKYECKTMN